MYLQPIIDKYKYWRGISKYIIAAWKNEFWDYLFELIQPIKQYYNDVDIVLAALREQRIQYVGDRFVGKFNAQISKELTSLGAKFDKRSKSYIIEKFKLPSNVQHAISMASFFASQLRDKIIQFVDNFDSVKFVDNLQDVLDIPLDEILEDLDSQRVRTIEDAIKIKVHFSTAEKEVLKKKYTEDVSKSIKKFTDNQLVVVRQLVQKNLFEGLDNKTLLNMLTRAFEGDVNKAKFIARQETGLLVSAYRQITYNRVGITQYRWSTSHDERVRQTHRELDGNIYSFDNPPVTNEKGDKNNPGEDWQCRCTPIPIFDSSV